MHITSQIWVSISTSRVTFSEIIISHPFPPRPMLDIDGKVEFLYLIRTILKLMQENFPKTWIPSVTLICDEHIWSFKGRTFLKRFMKDEPKKYRFLEHALCFFNGYYTIIYVSH